MYTARPTKTKHHRKPFFVLLLIGAYISWAILRPLPMLVPANAAAPLQLKTAAGSLAWPGNQAAAGVVGSNALETNGEQKAVPIASTAKIITALVVLDKKPLKAGEPGPTLTLTQKDVDIYQRYVEQNGSVVPIELGEQITQHQALQALMIPSSNNIADSLAIWAYGSLEAYVVAANQFVKKHGLTATTVGGDASGLSANTKSTARDLVLAGKLAMKQPALAEIVSKESTTEIPLAGTALNTNTLLGTNGVVGIKTGSTDEAGGVFVGAAVATVNNKPVTIVTAVVGALDRFSALRSSIPLVQSAQANFKPVTVIKAGNVVGRYNLPWGGSIAAIATKDETLNIWNGDTVKATIKLDEIPSTSKSGQDVGRIESQKSAFTDAHSVPVKLKDSPSTPSVWWRLSHPF